LTHPPPRPPLFPYTTLFRSANPAFGRARDQLQRALVGVDTFFLRDAREVLGDLRRGDAPEVEPLASRQDRRQHAVRLGRREHEEDRKSTRLNSSHDQISYAV